jgi:hypothetical protein
MQRFYKPARSKECGRGYFSYLAEAVGNLMACGCEDAKVFFDLCDVPGYGTGNMFDAAFVQDHEDYRSHRAAYRNVEEFPNLVGAYSESYGREMREKASGIIEKHFAVREEIMQMMEARFSAYDLRRVLGVHRRSTDIGQHHAIVEIEKIFGQIEQEDFDQVFLATDSMLEHAKFKQRYGGRLLFFDETSSSGNRPFFKVQHSQQEIEKHIREMVFTVYSLARTKKLICSLSNVSTFSILANPELEYAIL